MKKDDKKEIARKIKNLETDLRATLLAVDGKHTVLDEIFTNQAKRLREDIKNLKKTLT